jgi:hypothetical protein
MKFISLTAFLASVSTGAAIFPAQVELLVSLAVVVGAAAIMAHDYAARRPLVVRVIRRRAGPARTFFRAPELECDPCGSAPWTL